MSTLSSRRLDGKVAIVTGSNSGIGEETALMFALKGACVTLCGRNTERLDAVRTKCCELTGHPERFIAVSGDLTNQAVRTKTVEETVKTFGRLDILVANAGEASFPRTFMDVPEEDFDQMVDILLKSTVFLVQESVQHLESTKGSIVLLSSIAGIYQSPNLWVYSCMKASLNHLGRILAILLGPKGVRVNIACPGFAVTKIFRAVGDQADAMTSAFAITAGKDHPLENRVSTLKEQSEVISFLASDESSYVNGELIPVDGLCNKLCPGFNENFYLFKEADG